MTHDWRGLTILCTFGIQSTKISNFLSAQFRICNALILSFLNQRSFRLHSLKIVNNRDASMNMTGRWISLNQNSKAYNNDITALYIRQRPTCKLPVSQYSSNSHVSRMNPLAAGFWGLPFLGSFHEPLLADVCVSAREKCFTRVQCVYVRMMLSCCISSTRRASARSSTSLSTRDPFRNVSIICIHGHIYKTCYMFPKQTSWQYLKFSRAVDCIALKSVESTCTGLTGLHFLQRLEELTKICDFWHGSNTWKNQHFLPGYHKFISVEANSQFLSCHWLCKYSTWAMWLVGLYV